MWRMLARGGATTTTTDDDLNLGLERWPQKFPYSKLVTATNNFTEDRKLEEGGFGVVYRGFLDDLGRDVAIRSSLLSHAMVRGSTARVRRSY
ncbi:L-type lectin-domain containing receptor kinase IX.1 [Acorus calamus]|uniref:L-type lectin-domain containing receptor kinase IX.1 n=1 Tax=Acorus calamus TaxID=4465 RepID=A0AAV9EYC2_ACOCL|nr:L-type lectin-domain containing receptor kinase IX.1 [Acorus calamus]